MISMHSPEEKALAPRIRFSGFTDAWEQRRLGDFGTTYGGLSGKTKADFGHGAARFVPYTNVFDNPVTDIDRLEAVEIDPRQHEVRCGDVLFTVSSETPEEVGMSSLWLADQRNVYLNSFCFGYRQDGSFDSLYLAYVLRSQGVRRDLTLLAQGISRFNISKNKVMELLVPAPQAGEQRAIGTLLSRLDDLIALHQRKCDGMKTVKKSLLEKMFPREGETTPELRFAGFTDAWEQRRLRDITERVTAACDDAKLPRVEYEDIDSGEGTLNKPIGNLGHSRAGVAFLRGDVLYGKLRPYLHNWLFPQFEGIALGDFWVLRPKAVDPSYLYRLVQSSAFDELANISAGSKMPRADWHLVGDANFALPPNSVEQRKIGALFSCLDDLIALHQRKLNVLKNVKKSLLEGMFV